MIDRDIVVLALLVLGAVGMAFSNREDLAGLMLFILVIFMMTR